MREEREGERQVKCVHEALKERRVAQGEQSGAGKGVKKKWKDKYKKNTVRILSKII